MYCESNRVTVSWWECGARGQRSRVLYNRNTAYKVIFVLLLVFARNFDRNYNLNHDYHNQERKRTR